MEHTGDQDRWVQIDRILDEVIDLPEAEQSTRLISLCGEDTQLREEVERLLHRSGESDAFFGGIEPGFGQPIPQSAIDDLHRSLMVIDALPEEIGGYRVLDQIGQGGMGRVFLGERSDGLFDQKVAIKMVKRGMDSAEIVRRFEYERRILAQLEHQNIARILDGGLHVDGRPYFVMEYVEGKPLHAYCSEKEAALEEKLGLFIQVCDAVQAAHRQLVVHRDLKPANVLVDNQGQVKLLDFGIARVLDEHEYSSELPLTQEHSRRLTPQYAAPEQIRGGSITTSTDVYALGIILYELLTGARPYDVETTSFVELEKIICDKIPPSPSRRVRLASQNQTDKDQRSKSISGDLDAIALHCLKKEPEGRYRSAGDISDDLKRHLDGRPVSVRNDSIRYRLGKFIHRNRILVGTAAVVLPILLSGLVVQSNLNRQLEQESTVAESVSSLLNRILGRLSVRERSGRAITAAQLSSSLNEELPSISAGLSGNSELHSDLLLTLGNLSYEAGAYRTADSLLGVALGLSDERADPVKHADIMLSRGKAIRESVVLDTANIARALPLIRKSYSTMRAHLGFENESTIRAGMSTGFTLKLLRRFDRAIQVHSRLDSAISLTRYASSGVRGENLTNLADAYCDSGRYGRADSVHVVAVDLLRRSRGEVDPDLGLSIYHQGLCHFRQEDFELAVGRFREALAILEVAYGDDHTVVAEILNDLANTFLQQRRYSEANEYFAKAVPAFDRSLGPDSPRSLDTRMWYGYSLNNDDQFQRARDLLNRALAGFERRSDVYNAGLAAYMLLATYEGTEDWPNLAASARLALQRFRQQGHGGLRDPATHRVEGAWRALILAQGKMGPEDSVRYYDSQLASLRETCQGKAGGQLAMCLLGSTPS